MRFNKVFTAFSIFLLMGAGYYSSPCQSGINATGTGGMHTIQGRIYLPNGRTLDSSISVKLESPNHPSSAVYTDRNGGFSFRALTPGNYSIVVDAGENFMVTKEYFTIDAELQGSTIRITPIPKIFNVPIYLQFKPNVIQKNEVINAKLANIPKEALQHCRKGMEMERAGKSEEAIEEFRRAITIYPQFAIPHTELGKIFIRKGMVDDAVNELSIAIRFDATDFEARVNYGVALYRKGDMREAEKELRVAAELNKTAVTPHYYLGLVFMQDRNLDDAQKEMEAAKLLKGEKDLPLVHRYLAGIYYRKKQYQPAADELEQYVRLMPNAKDADQARKTIQELRSMQN